MIDRQTLLSDLQTVLRSLEADLLERTASAEVPEVPEVGEWLRAEYQKAKDAERTAHTYKQWLDDFITQVAAAWVLSCVFVRFQEDNELIDPPRIAGPGARLDRARDEHTLFFQDAERAKLTDREYLLDIVDQLAQSSAGKDVFGAHNPLRALPNWLGPDAAGGLLRFFQKIDSDSGRLVHDFTDPATEDRAGWDTRFLGDLYQDLSEAARKKYALLQTPDFVEEFILDRTLEPALDEFGLVVHHGDTYGRRNFMELLSVFMSAPLFTVLHGRHELGYVDVMTFLSKQEGPRVLLLGGRSWQVNHIDWQRRMAYVEPTEAKGRTRWNGQGQGLGFHLSQAIKRILATDAIDDCWSRRATDRLTEIRHEYAWLDADSTVAVQSGAGETEWWTFGGIRANAAIARQLSEQTHGKVDHDSFNLTFETSVKLQDVEEAVKTTARLEIEGMFPEINDAAIDGLKFSECLPPELATEMLEQRLHNLEATRFILNEHARFVVQQ